MCELGLFSLGHTHMVQLYGKVALTRNSTLVSRILHTLDSSPDVQMRVQVE